MKDEIIIEDFVDSGVIELDERMHMPVLENLTIIPGTKEQHFKSKKDGYNEIIVEPVISEELTIIPSTENQVKEGIFNKVTVAGDEYLKAENIKKGVNIFGVEGAIKEGIDTSDATATDADILEGTTAYITNGKAIGTMVNNGDITIIPEENEKITKPTGYYSNIEVEAVDKTDFYKNCKQLITDILNNESLVPDTFEQLEYVESTGEQYIKLSDWYNSTLSTTNFYDIVADVQFTVLPSEYDEYWHLNGVGASSGISSFTKRDTLLYFGYTYTNEHLSDPIPKFCYSPSLKNIDCVIDRHIDTERHTFKVISNANKAEAGFWIDDEHVEARGSTLATKKFGYPFYIFGYENDSGVIGNKQRVYRFQLLNDDGSLFYDLIPARRKSDNAIGLYDTVKGTFYTNNGTGEFLYGEIKTALEEDLQEILDIKTNKIIPENIKEGTNIFGVEGNAKTTNVKITDAQYLFYQGARLDYMNEILALCENVTNMRNMFYNCKDLTELNLSKFNTEKVTNMEYMFSHCSNLTSLDLSIFNTANVTNMSYMFYSCEGLTSLNLSSFNTDNVTGISRMFHYCNKLTELDLSNFNTKKVTSMDYMFNSCSNLTNLDISNFDTSNVKDMRYMFNSCSNLISLDLSNFDTSNVTNMNSMFDSCRSLQYLDIRNFTFDKVTSYSSMFYRVPVNCEIIVKSDVEKEWVLTQRSDLTNVKTVAELGE